MANQGVTTKLVSLSLFLHLLSCQRGRLLSITAQPVLATLSVLTGSPLRFHSAVSYSAFITSLLIRALSLLGLGRDMRRVFLEDPYRMCMAL